MFLAGFLSQQSKSKFFFSSRGSWKLIGRLRSTNDLRCLGTMALWTINHTHQDVYWQGLNYIIVLVMIPLSSIYLKIANSSGKTQIAIVTSKTKVAPIKRLTIPRLEFCGVYLLAQLLHHVQCIEILVKTACVSSLVHGRSNRTRKIEPRQWFSKTHKLSFKEVSFQQNQLNTS